IQSPNAKTAGDNPPQGAIIQYSLKKKPKDPIKLEILDEKGALVNTLTSKEEPDGESEDDPDGPEEPVKKTILTTEVGVNRVNWNLHYQGATLIKGAKIDSGDPKEGPLVS